MGSSSLAKAVLREATEFVKAVEKITGLKIACLEKIGLKMNFLDIDNIENSAMLSGNFTYSNYLLRKISNV